MRTINFILVAVLSVCLLVLSPLYAATHTVTSDADSGAGSLRAMIAGASAGDTIVFAPGIEEIILTGGITAANNLTINGGNGVVIKGGSIFGNMSSSYQITLNNLTFADNTSFVSFNGLTLPSLTINNENLVFDSHSDGAISIVGSNLGLPVLTFNNTGTLIFSNNGSAVSIGGAIFYSSDLVIGNNAIFTNNTTGYSNGGGAIYASNVTIGDSATFTGNSTGGGWFGGAIAPYDDLTVGNFATFTNNSAEMSPSGGGGAIGSAGSASVFTFGNNSTFSGNAAGGSGGAIFHTGYFDGVNLTFGNRTLFTENSSRGSYYGDDLGGGAISTGGSISITGNTFFTSNLASKSGGAIAMYGASSLQTTLDTTDGDIAFSGNKGGVTFTETSPGVFTPSGGIANSIHLQLKANLNLTGNNNIYFDDPISSGTGSNSSLTKSGTGFVQFLGDNRLNTTGYTATANSVDIQAGTFRLANNATFDASGAGNFNVAATATLAGQGTITAEGFTIAGTVSPDSDRFEIPNYLKKGDPGTTDTNYNFFETGRTTRTRSRHFVFPSGIYWHQTRRRQSMKNRI